MLGGLRVALDELRRAGCLTAYVDGSFVSSKPEPGVDLDRLDPVLLTFDGGRAAQKIKYKGELFPASAVAGLGEGVFVDFFQTDKDTGARKGIVALDLGGLT